jgi:hypothetical protein
MAKRLAIPSEELKLTIVGAYDELDVTRVQRLTINKDVPSTDVYEIGNNQLVGVTTDAANVTLTFSVFDVSIKTFAVLTGNDPLNYPGVGADIADLGEVDAILYVKSATIADFAKSAHAQRLQVRDFTFNYAVDTESSEDYTLIGSSSRWFKNDVQVDRFTTGTDSFNLNETPIQLINGNYGLSVILDGEYLEEVSIAPVAGEYRIVGTTLTTFDTRTQQVLAVYHANPAGDHWSYVSDTLSPAATKGRDVTIVILAENIPRVQSVTINGTLNTQPVSEMGNPNIVGYQSQTPAVDGTLTVFDTDTELLDLLLNGSISSGATEFEFGVECVASGVDLQIQIYDPCDDESILKTVYIPELVLTGDSYTSTVNQNAQQTFNWKSSTAQVIVYSGAKP